MTSLLNTNTKLFAYLRNLKITPPSPESTSSATANSTEPPVITDWQNLNSQTSWLEQQVGNPMAGRIRQLLDQSYFACPADKKYGDEFPNCFGTPLWVIGADIHTSPQMYGHPNDGQWDDYDNFSYAEGTQNLVMLVESHGYHLIKSSAVLSVNPRLAAIRRSHEEHGFESESKNKHSPKTKLRCLTQPSPITSSLASLQPGDLLFFGNKNTNELDFVHAAIYLGTSPSGEHIIFEKESSGCGAGSKFRLTTLETYLQEASTTEDIQPIFDFSLMWIYRAPK